MSNLVLVRACLDNGESLWYMMDGTWASGDEILLNPDQPLMNFCSKKYAEEFIERQKTPGCGDQQHMIEGN
jgi:hypothetical protein